MLIYLVTFILCILMDYLPTRQFFLLKRIFLIWLYIFLCFGYTVGTDWRNYENLYNDSFDQELLDRNFEQASYYLIYIARKIIPDFWLYLGLFKCIYLYSILKFIKRFTVNQFLSIAVLLNYNLLFMLVDNPLRFMQGSIILVWCTGYLLDKKYTKFLLFSLLSLLFHISLVVPVLLSLLVLFKDKIIHKSNVTLSFWYLIAFVFSFFPNILNEFSVFFANQFPALAYKLLNAYAVESNEGAFTIGSFVMIILFFVLLYHRKTILANKNGDILFFYSLFYLYLSRVLLIFPTGFRLSLYFGLFFAICLVVIITSGSLKVKYALFILIGLTISKTLWSSFQYLPYTNSIYYILTSEHLPRSYRDNLNKEEYYRRTGEQVKSRAGID